MIVERERRQKGGAAGTEVSPFGLSFLEKFLSRPRQTPFVLTTTVIIIICVESI
jgi:hypothetical protein